MWIVGVPLGPELVPALPAVELVPPLLLPADVPPPPEDPAAAAALESSELHAAIQGAAATRPTDQKTCLKSFIVFS
jgi:hypothetical protein